MSKSRTTRVYVPAEEERRPFAVSWTLVIALWGAVTGTLGFVVALLNRRDGVWARRARARDARPDVEGIRDLLAEAKADPARAAGLTSGNGFRARITAIEDAVDRCPDRTTRKALTQITVECLSLANTASNAAEGSVNYALTTGIDKSLYVVVDLLKRFNALDRRAPS